MAVAEATSVTLPEARRRGRLAGALAGLVLLAVAVAIYTQLGTLGLGLAPSVVLLAATLPLFVVAGAAIRHWTGADKLEHTGYPFQLAFPSLAYYCAFFLIPLAFLVLFAVATPVGFGEVQYGFDLSNFSAGLDSLYVEVFLRTLRTAAIGTLLIVLVGYPLAYWIARYAPERRRGLFLALIIVPFWTSFLIRTYSFLIVLSPEFFLSDWLQSLKLTDEPLDVLYTTSAIQIGLVYNYLPLFVLPLYATLERMDWRPPPTSARASGRRSARSRCGSQRRAW
jgi:spermidine/putrescine transport system permease protein